MKCHCGLPAVIARPPLCSVHLVEFVHDHVCNTIQEYGLFTKSDRVLVAASGGKDSVTLLDVLHSLGYAVDALAVDEGIQGYRPQTLQFLQGFCKERSIPLRIVSFEEEVGVPLDHMVKDRHPCSICGVLRRYALNKYAHGYDVIATGHNLDDEAQAVLMNLIKDNKDLLFRSHVRTPDKPGFTPRVKPLMFIPEKVITAYSFVRGFGLTYGECPYVPQSLRGKVSGVLNAYESGAPGMKLKLVEAAVAIASQGSGEPAEMCSECGQPSAHTVCRACLLKKELSSS